MYTDAPPPSAPDATNPSRTPTATRMNRPKLPLLLRSLLVTILLLGHPAAFASLADAQAAFSRGDYARAARLAADAAYADPTDPAPALLAARAFEQAGDPFQANAWFLAASLIAPNDADIQAAYAASQSAILPDPQRAMENIPSPEEQMARLESEIARRSGQPVGVGKSFKATKEVVIAEEEQKNWFLELTFAAGWNSNVLALGDGVDLPLGATRPDAAFFMMGADTWYQWQVLDRGLVRLGYFGQQYFYDGIVSANLNLNYWYLDLQYWLTNRLLSSFRISDEYDSYNGYSFRNVLAIEQSLLYRWADWNSSWVSYRYSWGDYFFVNAFPFWNRDGQEHRISARHHFFFPDGLGYLSAGYHHTFNLADGSDFDFNEDGIGISLLLNLPWELVLKGEFQWLYRYYQNNNSLAGPAGFEYARKDVAAQVGVELERPIWRAVIGFARYDFIHNDSNISFYDYDQHVVSGGVRLRF